MILKFSKVKKSIEVMDELSSIEFEVNKDKYELSIKNNSLNNNPSLLMQLLLKSNISNILFSCRDGNNILEHLSSILLFDKISILKQLEYLWKIKPKVFIICIEFNITLLKLIFTISSKSIFNKDSI